MDPLLGWKVPASRLPAEGQDLNLSYAKQPHLRRDARLAHNGRILLGTWPAGRSLAAHAGTPGITPLRYIGGTWKWSPGRECSAFLETLAATGGRERTRQNHPRPMREADAWVHLRSSLQGGRGASGPAGGRCAGTPEPPARASPRWVWLLRDRLHGPNAR